MNIHEQATFLSFADELKGMYDGSLKHVDFEYGRHVLVAHHESIHQLIMQTCPDGQLMGFILAGRLRSSQESSGTKIYDSFVEALFHHSRFAHEVAATYLSVKMYPPDKQYDQLDHYPDEYLDYYQFLSSVLDGVFTSSYLQYLIGWNIATVAFSSELLPRFLSGLPNVPETIHIDERPNDRLMSIIKAFTTDNMQSLLKNMQFQLGSVVKGLNHEEWNVDDESGWNEADLEVKQYVELGLSDTIKEWIYNISGLKELEYTDEITKKAIAFAKSIGVNCDITPAFRKPEQLADHEYQQAMQAGNSVIFIPKSRLISAQVTHVSEIQNTLKNCHHTMISVFDIQSLFHVIGFSDKEEKGLAYIASVDEDGARKVLQPTGVLVDSIILGIRSISCLAYWIVFLMEPEAIKATRASSGYKFDIYRYLHGNYAIWLETLQKPLYLASINMKSPDFQNGGGVLRIIKQEATGDVYIRLLDVDASIHMRRFESQLVKQGLISAMDDVTLNYYKSRMPTIIGFLSQTWERL